MIRGKRLFICDRCRKKFMAPDIEYAATTYSVPQECPYCSSHNTMPYSLLACLHKTVYRKIWENEENNRNKSINNKNKII